MKKWLSQGILTGKFSVWYVPASFQCGMSLQLPDWVIAANTHPSHFNHSHSSMYIKEGFITRYL